jgi:hypothetical protein
LKDHLNPAPIRSQIGAYIVDVLNAVKPNLALGRRLEQHQHPSGGGFSTSTLADKS